MTGRSSTHAISYNHISPLGNKCVFGSCSSTSKHSKDKKSEEFCWESGFLRKNDFLTALNNQAAGV